MALLVLEWTLAVSLLAVGVMLLAVGAFLLGGATGVAAVLWLVRCVRRS